MSARATFVIPALNAQETIDRTLRSLAAQSLAAWDAVIVNDGSSDATAAICHEWAARDARITLLSQARAGVSAARNVGIDAAGGEFLVFLDADDTIHRHYVKRMLAAMASRPRADAVCCGSVMLSRLGLVIERSAAPRLDRTPLALCRKHAPAPVHAMMVRRSRVVEVGRFNPELASYEDWDFWLRLVQAGVEFVVERRKLAFYWRSEVSSTSNGPQMMRGYRVVEQAAQQRMGHRVDAASTEEQLEAALWNSGLAIGRGEDAAPILDGLLGPVVISGDKHDLANALLRGLAIGSQSSVQGFIHRWEGFAPPITAFLDQLEHRLQAPGAAYALLKALERETIRGDLAGVKILSRTVGVMIGAHVLQAGIDAGGQVDSVMFRVPGRLAVLEAPLWGPLSGKAVRALIVQQGWRRLLRSARLETSLPDVMQRVDRPLRLAVRLARRVKPRVERGPPPAASALPEQAETGPAAIVAAERARVAAEPIGVAVQPRPPAGVEPFELEGEALVEAWDAFFETADPWNYDSAYEQLKYDRTFAMIPPGPVGRALELACAEGRFTQRLAARAEHVRALDISRRALDRAAERCRDFTNLDYVAADFFAKPIEGQWDLITCAEVLYYMPDAAGLAVFASHVRDALNPGGHFIQAHAFEVGNTPGRSGFDWATPCDGQHVADVFRRTEGLQHVRALVTDIYRIDLFRKSDTPIEPVTEQAPLGSALDYRVERFVIWNGPVARRADVAHERAFRLPVLMYHRIAADGPADLAPYRLDPDAFAHQLRFLRRRGFRSVSPEEWQSAQRRGSLAGRPIMLTFDDAYLDFFETAWPILRSNDFTAHVFVPTAHVGSAAVWDAAYGDPAPLMTWRHIAELAAEGVTFGSHLASHTRADGLDSGALLREAARSRAQLESVLGVEVNTVAPPFGISDHRVEQVLAAAGYRQGFLDGGGAAAVFGSRMATPRIEIAGGDDIDVFAAKVGMAAHPPDAKDMR